MLAKPDTDGSQESTTELLTSEIKTSENNSEETFQAKERCMNYYLISQQSNKHDVYILNGVLLCRE